VHAEDTLNEILQRGGVDAIGAFLYQDGDEVLQMLGVWGLANVAVNPRGSALIAQSSHIPKIVQLFGKENEGEIKKEGEKNAMKGDQN